MEYSRFTVLLVSAILITDQMCVCKYMCVCTRMFICVYLNAIGMMFTLFKL